MEVDALTVIGVLLSIVAFLAFLVVNYDGIISRYLSWRHTPDIDLGISLGKENFVEDDSIPCTDLQPYDEGLMFEVAVANSGEIDAEMDLEIAVGPSMKTPTEYFDVRGESKTGYSVENTYHGLGGKPPKRYSFNSFSVPSNSYGRHINFVLDLNPEEVKVFKSSRVLLSGQIQAEASQFSVPLLGWNFPDKVGDVNLGSVQREYDILGPHHEDVDMSELEKEAEEVKEIEIEHPHGYLLDSEEKVIARFAGWSPGFHKVSGDVEQVEYVDGRDGLEREVHPDYKPEPLEPPWEE